MAELNDVNPLSDNAIDPKVKSALTRLINEVSSANSASDRRTTRIRIIIESQTSDSGFELPDGLPDPATICHRQGKTPITVLINGQQTTICCPGHSHCPASLSG